MATNKETGIIENTVLKQMNEKVQIEWRIPDITMVIKAERFTSYDSPSFFINDVSWFLRLFPTSVLDKEFMRLYIRSNVGQDFSPEYNISLKKLDGSEEHLVSGIPKKATKKCFDLGLIIRRSQLMERKSELAPHDVLTIICRFKRELVDFTEPSDKTMPLKLISK